MFIKNQFQKIVSMILILPILLSGFQVPSVLAQGQDGLKRRINAQTGRVSFIGPESGRALPASRALGIFLRPQDPAMALANRFAPEFGIKNPARELSAIKTRQSQNGRVIVRYQQNHQGVPVMGGELIINTNGNGDLYSMNGEVSPNLALPTQPGIDSIHATQTALQAIAKYYRKTPADFVTTNPELWIFDESLLRPSTRPAELVWRMEVTAVENSLPVRELVLVNARTGGLSLHFNQIDNEWAGAAHSHAAHLAGNPPPHGNHGSECRVMNQGVTSTAGITHCENGVSASPSLLLHAPHVNTYTAGDTSTLPGTLLCNQTQPNCTNGSDSHADAAHKYAIGTYNFYANNFLRDSIDNNGMVIKSTVHYCDPMPFFGCPYGNAFWSGDQMVYGDAFSFPLADDVVAHELTHGVTQHESNLFYYYQAGAINESFSDVFGEYYDQTNGLGNDTVGVKWQIGEEVSDVGPFRSMSDPTAFGDPDKMSSSNYAQSEEDYGGVHHNSGINNKAVYLLVNGGTFNGRTVSALGWEKTGAIYYEVNTNLLTSGADYSDLYYALQQACTNLIGQKGITSGNCTEVKDAMDAVEMNAQPAPNFNTEAPFCDNGHPPSPVFFDNLESGTGNWVFGALTGTSRWQYDSPDGPFAHSGLHSLYAADSPAAVTDTYVRTKNPILIPPQAFMRFDHAFGFEDIAPTAYDGGILEYSTNGGVTWQSAGSLFLNNGYNGSIKADELNPLAGQTAFVMDSHGYISSRLSLQSLANQSVLFRWRMGLDPEVADQGWWLDDVQIYVCNVPLSRDTVGVFRPSNGALYLKNSNTNGFADVAINYGLAGDYPVVGDWDGDGDDTIGVYRNGTFYLRNSNTLGIANITVAFGSPGDQPIAGDWNNDGVDTIGVYRSATGTFLLRNTNTPGPADLTFALGNVGDVGIAGDWNGDGTDTTGVFRPSNGVIFLKNTNSSGIADVALNYGLPGDQPVVGDWDNNGTTTIGIYRNARFYLRNSNTNGFANIFVDLGNVGDMPIAGDWDGKP